MKTLTSAETEGAFTEANKEPFFRSNFGPVCSKSLSLSVGNRPFLSSCKRSLNTDFTRKTITSSAYHLYISIQILPRSTPVLLIALISYKFTFSKFVCLKKHTFVVPPSFSIWSGLHHPYGNRLLSTYTDGTPYITGDLSDKLFPDEDVEWRKSDLYYSNYRRASSHCAIITLGYGENSPWTGPEAASIPRRVLCQSKAHRRIELILFFYKIISLLVQNLTVPRTITTCGRWGYVYISPRAVGIRPKTSRPSARTPSRMASPFQQSGTSASSVNRG